MAGACVLGDFCSGQLWAMARDRTGAWKLTEQIKTSIRISSFGEDEVGEIYLTDLVNGRIFRVTASAR